MLKVTSPTLIMKNPAFNDPSVSYYVQEKRFLFHLIPDGPNRVLDLGCAAGRLGDALLECGKAAELYGVEIFPAAAEKAAKSYKHVHVGDIEEMTLEYDNFFDVIICGDVLEHLKNPDKVLGHARRWLKDSGTLVCCVPNVRYWKVWRDLVFGGDWAYAQEGIMDQTHLRFFTTKSFRRMLESQGFIVKKQDMRMAVGPKQEWFNRLTGGLFRDVLGFQMLFAAVKTRGVL
jgi:2-polyprenyl-3-methyl-5-hydroxy-6-metoxy-1,4-benzoquinol methylase